MPVSNTMSVIDCIVFLVSILLCLNTYAIGEISSRGPRIQHVFSRDYYDYAVKPSGTAVEKVNIQLYYECFCGDCREFETSQFIEVVQKLHEYLNIQTYPYGNADTFERNGKYYFRCQHGPGECYGNKLHACALNIIRNHTEALQYNSCMMGSARKDRGSDDQAAQECGTIMYIDYEPIKACAKGEQGIELLKYYGDESKRAKFQYVPYILVNGKENDGSNFMRDVCAAYANPPPPCTTIV